MLFCVVPISAVPPTESVGFEEDILHPRVLRPDLLFEAFDSGFDLLGVKVLAKLQVHV